MMDLYVPVGGITVGNKDGRVGLIVLFLSFEVPTLDLNLITLSVIFCQ